MHGLARVKNAPYLLQHLPETKRLDEGARDAFVEGMGTVCHDDDGDLPCPPLERQPFRQAAHMHRRQARLYQDDLRRLGDDPRDEVLALLLFAHLEMKPRQIAGTRIPNGVVALGHEHARILTHEITQSTSASRYLPAVQHRTPLLFAR